LAGANSYGILTAVMLCISSYQTTCKAKAPKPSTIVNATHMTLNESDASELITWP